MLAAVKSLLTFAHTAGYLPFNPGRGLRLPAARGRLAERIPTEEDVLTLLAHEPNRRNHALIRLLYTAGLRLSEACDLRWRDVQPRGEAGQVAVWGKGEKERVVLITAGTWRELAALRPADARPDAPVFRSRHGRPLSPSQAWRVSRPRPCARAWRRPPRSRRTGSATPTRATRSIAGRRSRSCARGWGTSAWSRPRATRTRVPATGRAATCRYKETGEDRGGR